MRVQTPQGEFGGMLNLGPRPTFGEADRRIEAHVFDASHDWYGAPVRIDFVARLRDTQAFADVSALVEQLRAGRGGGPKGATGALRRSQSGYRLAGDSPNLRGLAHFTRRLPFTSGHRHRWRT